MKTRLTLLAGLIATVLPSLVAAQSFSCITNNGACSSAESYLGWSYSGNNLTISNSALAGNDSFIRNIYFDYSANMSVSYLSDTGNVNFLFGGSPGNLPGGNTAAPAFVSDSTWTADNPGATYGVNAGESITFAMSGVTLANFADGSMRVGVHLQGLPGSESLITSAVPEPETYALMLAGLGLMGAVARRRKAGRA